MCLPLAAPKHLRKLASLKNVPMSSFTADTPQMLMEKELMNIRACFFISIVVVGKYRQ
jgi:hypothetical protein